MAWRSSRLRQREPPVLFSKRPAAPNKKHRPKAKVKSKPAKRNRALYMREYRAKLKAHPQRYIKFKKADAARKRNAKEEGKIKSRDEMTDREVRFVRKRGKEYVQRHRERKKRLIGNIGSLHEINQNSSTVPPLKISLKNMASKQKRSGEKRRRKHLAALQEKIRQLEGKITGLKRKIWRLQKKATRARVKIPFNDLSPNSKTKRLTQGKFMPKSVVDELKFASALQCDLKHTLSLLNGRRETDLYSRILCGRILKQYKLLHRLKSTHLGCLKQMRRCRKMDVNQLLKDKKERSQENKLLVDSIQQFYISDTASSACPYKREFKTVDGVRHQKRFLNDSLRVLYRTFISLMPVKCSYPTFCRYRPKWVVARKLNGRDTCLCKKCENFKLLHATAHSVKLVNAKDADALIKTVCCEPQTEQCLLGDCAACVHNSIQYLPGNPLAPVMFRKWVDTTEQRMSTKKKDKAGNPLMIDVKVTKKIEIYSTMSEFQDILANALRPHMAHLGRIQHQRNSINHLREDLLPNELLLTFDWSEDYEGKWGSEPQSTHFGGSRPRFALHTGRAISMSVEQSFCTLSNSTRHDPKAIIAHLKPILSDYLGRDPRITHLHIQTDGPVTQYRNTKLYYLLTQHLLPAFPQIKNLTWNITEAGHGKSVADAVGGTTKGLLDQEVARGRDIVTVDKMFEVLQRQCPTIKFHVISEQRISEVDRIHVPEMKGAVKGTLQLHQYLWQSESRDTIHFKKLSCYKCPRDRPCEHYVLIESWNIPSVPVPVQTASSKKRKQKKTPVSGTRKSSRLR